MITRSKTRSSLDGDSGKNCDHPKLADNDLTASTIYQRYQDLFASLGLQPEPIRYTSHQISIEENPRENPNELINPIGQVCNLSQNLTNHGSQQLQFLEIQDEGNSQYDIQPSPEMASSKDSTSEKQKEVVESFRFIPLTFKPYPCRRAQAKEIFEFTFHKLKSGSGGCLYISGEPQSGKTHTIGVVVEHLNNLVTKAGAMKTIYLQGNSLAKAEYVYEKIYEQLEGTSIYSHNAQDILDEMFLQQPQRHSRTLIVIDQIDQLCSKNEDVVCNIIRWSHRPSANVVVIAVGNTVNLLEEIFRKKNDIILLFTKVIFPPYSGQEISESIVLNLKEMNILIQDYSMEEVAQKIAAVHRGDVSAIPEVCIIISEIGLSVIDKILSAHARVTNHLTADCIVHDQKLADIQSRCMEQVQYFRAERDYYYRALRARHAKEEGALMCTEIPG